MMMHIQSFEKIILSYDRYKCTHVKKTRATRRNPHLTKNKVINIEMTLYRPYEKKLTLYELHKTKQNSVEETKMAMGRAKLPWGFKHAPRSALHHGYLFQ